MGKVSRCLRESGPRPKGYIFFCPGCEQPHQVNVDNTNGARWTFNNNVERPTFTPSVLCFTTYDENNEHLPDGQRRTLCHSFVTDGKIQFLDDCPHKLKGQTVPLPDLPDWLSD